ncbi:MAG TPA: hypothetical protein VLF60_00240 [Candidatus Saccharimonadales bacterium]|nr:hypothetical protein [Candidatus Saccharimonadales bacterium]
MMVWPRQKGGHVVERTVEVQTSLGTMEHGLRAHYLGKELCRVEVEIGDVVRSLDLVSGKLTYSDDDGEVTFAPVEVPPFHRDTSPQRSAALEANIAYTGRVTQLTYALAQMAGAPAPPPESSDEL